MTPPDPSRLEDLRAALEAIGNACNSPGDWRGRRSVYVDELGVTLADTPFLLEIARRWFAPSYWEEWKDAPQDDFRIFAPVHAWRSLGHLRAAEAAGELVAMLEPLERADHGEWMLEEFPYVIGWIGEPAFAPLEKQLNTIDEYEWVRVAAAGALRVVAQEYPGLRGRVVGVLTEKLGNHAADTPLLNGCVVGDLVSLEAAEAAEAIEQAYAAGAVDSEMVGDWEYVRYDLGLGPKPEGPRYARLDPAVFSLGGPHRGAPDARKKRRAKRKQERRNRKRNRR